MSKILGLDLGTSASSFSLWDGHKLVMLPLQGQVSIPSLLVHETLGNVLIGKDAATYSEQSPQNCYRSLMRLLGMRKTDLQSLGKHRLYQYVVAPVAHIQNLSTNQKKVFEDRKNNPEVWINDGYRILAPALLIAEYLLELYHLAEEKLPQIKDLHLVQSIDIETGLISRGSSSQIASSGAADAVQGADQTATSQGKASPSTTSQGSATDAIEGEGGANSLDDDVQLYITCPSHFNLWQRRLLLDAAALAKIPCKLVSESTANLLFFGNTFFNQLSRQKLSLDNRLVMMCSWGASKFECSIAALNYQYRSEDESSDLLIDYQGSSVLEMQAIASRTELAGDEITWAIVDLLVEDFAGLYQIDLYTSRDAIQRLFIAAEKAKIELSKSLKTDVLVPYIYKQGDRDLHINVELNRDRLHTIYQVFIRKAYVLCVNCLESANLSWDDISQVVLLGGACQWPLFTDEFKRLIKDGGLSSKLMPPNIESRLFSPLDMFLGADRMGERTLFRDSETSGYVPKFISLEPVLTPAAVGAVLYGVYNQGGMGKQCQLVECMPYVVGLGTESSEVKELLPRCAPLPASAKQLVTVFEQPRETLITTFNPSAWFKIEKSEAEGEAKFGSVTILLRQGKVLIAELTLPHVRLVRKDQVAKRTIGDIFIKNSPDAKVLVAEVSISLEFNESHELSVTLMDANGANCSKTWALPEATLNDVEFTLMQQNLWVNYMLDQKRRQIKTLSALSPADFLSYLDANPQYHGLVENLTGLNLKGNDEQPREAISATANTTASAATVNQGDSTLLKNEQNTNVATAIKQAQDMLSRQQGAAGSLDLNLLGQVVNQNFADQLNSVLDKASAQLSSYHQCKAEINELKKLLAVSLQEYSRFKQKSEQELSKTKRFAIEKVLKDLLPVFDALDQAVSFAKEHNIDEAILKGQEQILDLMSNVLQQHQVEIVDPTGELFDPQVHQALSMLETTEVLPKHVAKTLQKGWVLNGRVLRPAQVLVAKAPE